MIKSKYIKIYLTPKGRAKLSMRFTYDTKLHKFYIRNIFINDKSYEIILTNKEWEYL